MTAGTVPAVEDALAQLGRLQTPAGYYNAGVPNYEHLFGRDSCISALQMLHRDSAPARATLDVLARFAGNREALRWEEYPGKIPHEHYPGGRQEQWHDLVTQGDRLRRLGTLLFWRFPYYGSVDAGAWYLILLHHYLTQNPDPQVAAARLPTALGIVHWLEHHATHAHTKLVGFRRHYIFGLHNQSWKDNLTENFAKPIAMVEVQGYYYYALKLLADLCDKYADDADQGKQLRAQAAVLKAEFERYFTPQDGALPMLVDGHGKAVRLAVSNPGHLLFSGILDRDAQTIVARRLMQPDLLTPYGIRTESTLEPSFSTGGYQNGAIWPFDNWVIHQGLKKCGFTTEADTIKEALLRAHHDLGYFPEAYSASAQGRISSVHGACRIQAWSAGALVNLIDDAPPL